MNELVILSTLVKTSLIKIKFYFDFDFDPILI